MYQIIVCHGRFAPLCTPSLITEGEPKRHLLRFSLLLSLTIYIRIERNGCFYLDVPNVANDINIDKIRLDSNLIL